MPSGFSLDPAQDKNKHQYLQLKMGKLLKYLIINVTKDTCKLLETNQLFDKLAQL